MNFMFKSGNEFMQKMGFARLTRQLNEVNKNTPEIFEEMTKQIIELYDQKSGRYTTDLKTF